LFYKWESDALSAPDLTVMAEHLFKSYPAVEMALSKLPDRIFMWSVRTANCGPGVSQRARSRGWSRLITDGEFESVSVISGADRDEVWVAVKREIDGATLAISSFLNHSSPLKQPKTRFLWTRSVLLGDGHIHALRPGPSGGKEVQVLSEGPSAAANRGERRYHAARSVTQAHVGLPFTSILSPVEPEIPTNTGTSHGRIHRISRVVARLHKTLGIKQGPDLENLRNTPFRDSSMPMGEAVGLFSGDLPLSWDGAYARTNRIYLVQDQPLPMTVLAIFVEAELYDR
jgi:hypothetical protein